MNTNCVLWDPYFNMWNGYDIAKIQTYVKNYFLHHYYVEVHIPSEKIFHLLLSLQKNVRPKTGDIFTRCFLDDEIPDQFYSKQNILDEAISIIIGQIEDDISITIDPMNIWNSVYQNDIQFFPKPKINQKRPKQIISMKF